jgi:hypothetical protein
VTEVTYVHPPTGREVYVNFSGLGDVAERAYTYPDTAGMVPLDWGPGKSTAFLYATGPGNIVGALIAAGFELLDDQ